MTRKLGVALECMIDLDEVQETFLDRWYGDNADRPKSIPWERVARSAFIAIPPRKGMLGFLGEVAEEGGQITFFSNTQDPVLGERGEAWLREWTNDAFLVMAQTNHPANLDVQAIFLPEGSRYDIPAGRPRVAYLPVEGPFNPKSVQWAWDLENEGLPPATKEPAPKPKGAVVEAGDSSDDDEAVTEKL